MPTSRTMPYSMSLSMCADRCKSKSSFQRESDQTGHCLCQISQQHDLTSGRIHKTRGENTFPLIVCVCGGAACAMVHVHGSEVSLPELVLSFHPAAPGECSFWAIEPLNISSAQPFSTLYRSVSILSATGGFCRHVEAQAPYKIEFKMC